jgi:hypothetical protein
MAVVVRTDEEIWAARERAQKATYAAEDVGGRDPEASAIYDFVQWLTGNLGSDPTEEMGMEDDDPLS